MKNKGEIIIYESTDGLTKIDVKMVDETVWLTQTQLVELYQSSKSNISEHIKNIFAEGELNENQVVREFRTTAADGKNYNTKFYNLDMILSLGGGNYWKELLAHIKDIHSSEKVLYRQVLDLGMGDAVIKF